MVIHGGSWTTGDKTELSWLLNGLKQKGFAVANKNYRLTLSTGDHYKMQLDDIDSAVQFSLRQASIHTFNGQKLYLVGNSAGGYLSLCYAYSRNTKEKIKAVGSIAGPTDLFGMSYYNYNLYNSLLTSYLCVSLFPSSPEATQRYKDCSPKYQATATAPPTIFFQGENDPVVFTDQSTSMYVQLGTSDVERKIIMYPLTFHDWWTDGNKTANTIEELKNWFTGHP